MFPIIVVFGLFYARLPRGQLLRVREYMLIGAATSVSELVPSAVPRHRPIAITQVLIAAIFSVALSINFIRDGVCSRYDFTLSHGEIVRCY